ncbi:MAG: hypothetical protein QW540_03045 [Archaeoglobaceae archaeon]
MKCSDILKLASKSKLLDDPYVSKIWKLIDDTSLFKNPQTHFLSFEENYFENA